MKPTTLRSGIVSAAAVLLAASLCLGASCQPGRTQAGVGGPVAASGDITTKVPRPPNLGWGRKPRGLIEGIFDPQPGEDRVPPDRSDRASQQPFIDMMRHAYGPGRQAYEEPLQEARAPLRPRVATRPPRRKKP